MQEISLINISPKREIQVVDISPRKHKTEQKTEREAGFWLLFFFYMIPFLMVVLWLMGL